MHTVSARDERAKPVPPRKPPSTPRTPLGWEFNHARREVSITDCEGRESTYNVDPLPAAFGRAWRLTRPDGESYDIHFDGPAHSCTCPGGAYRGLCKHTLVLAVLAAGGVL
jgi:hypothetical protein